LSAPFGPGFLSPRRGARLRSTGSRDPSRAWHPERACLEAQTPPEAIQLDRPSYSPLLGQVALGLRSLLVRSAIFFVLAAALAWALGGTLFPRPERVEGPSVDFDSHRWNVRMSVGGDHPGEARFELMRATIKGDSEPFGGEFADATALVVTDASLFVAMRRREQDGGQWVLRRVARGGPKQAEQTEQTEPLDSRLDAEQRLELLVGR